MPFVFYRENTLGFSLIELVITLVIAGTLVALAVPSMRYFIFDNRLSVQTNEFLADLQLARTEAIKRGTTVTVCKSSNPDVANVPATPAPACNATDADPWTTGRIMFVDSGSGTSANDGNGVRDAGEELLRARSVLDGNNKALGDGSAGGTANRVIFRANGLTTLSPANGNCVVNTGTAASENQMIVCDRRGFSQARVIVISPTGRVRVATKGTDMKGDVLTAIICGASTLCPAL